MLKTTPFHARTSALMQANQWRRWAGYTAASAYEMTHDREYLAIRNACALIDISPLCKYEIAGPDALRFLNRLVTRDVSTCQVGGMLYTPWCDSHGKIVDDGTIARLDAERYRLTSAEPNLRWLEDNALGMDVRIADVSEQLAALALQGPTSRALLQSLCDAPLSDLPYYGFLNTTIADCPVMISRTGYTGDLGYELWLAAEPAVAGRVWDALVAAGRSYGLQPAGIWALDVARIEAGLLLLDVDYVSARKALIEPQKSSPLELGLEWTVGFDKPAFVGREALVAERERPAEWRFTGVEVAWEPLEALYTDLGLAPRLPTTAWRTSVPLYAPGSEHQVGYATSGCWSPLLKRYLTLAHLEAPYAEPGRELDMEVTVEHRRKRARANVCALPFFNPGRKRA